MLNFIGVCGFESTIKKERKKYDACVREYNGKVISVRCIQSTEDKLGGWVAWVWTQDGDKLVGDYKMCGIAHIASDLPLVISEAKKFIDTL